MFGHVTYFLVFVIVVGVSDGAIRTWTVSSKSKFKKRKKDTPMQCTYHLIYVCMNK